MPEIKDRNKVFQLIDLLLGLYAWTAIIMWTALVIRGAANGLTQGFTVVPLTFYKLIDLPYSTALDAIFTLATVLLVILYLVRFINFVLQYRREEKRIRQARSILWSDLRELESLIEYFESQKSTRYFFDPEFAKGLRKRLQQRHEELDQKSKREEKQMREMDEMGS